MFSINCLEITTTKEQWVENQSLYKNLLSKGDYDNFDAYKKEHPTTTFSKRFFFNDFYYHEQYGDLKDRPKEERTIPDDFFGKNINIQAIVGKNGSGKSSLMDLMYMAINNFAFMFERGEEFQAARKLYWIKGLSINIYFSIISDRDWIDTESRLKCTPESINLQIKDGNSFKDYIDVQSNGNGTFSLGRDNTPKGYALYGLLREFFYTIVSNYSLQSFVISNYTSNCILYSKKDDVQNPKHFNLCNKISTTFPDYQYTEGKISWVESIFHKNDGYTCPIVLNPKRDDRGINIEQELSLAKYREIALLLWSQQNKKEFINGYQLQRIDFQFDEDYALEKSGKNSIDEILNEIDQQISHPDDKIISPPCFADWLISIEKFNISSQSPKLVRIGLSYLIYKIKSITKYPHYYRFSKGQEKSVFVDEKTTNKKIEANLRELLEEVDKDKSHSVTKIKQTINFLNYDWLSDDKKTATINNWYSHIFDNSSYYKIYPQPSEKLDDIINNLPPPFFKYDVFLSKISNNTIDNTPINLRELSSGEHQLIQTLSTHVYHIRNLISIIESNKFQTPSTVRPEYRNINLVFDEMEICFHPEYQRQFVNHLITTIKNMGLNEQCTFNIFLITHSPFILSDIPRSNILYMETEKDKAKNKKLPTHTFAQNIGDMMYDSFFMEKTIGDFAEEKLRKLIQKRLEKNSKKKQKLMSDVEEQAVLSSIGDPVIRSLIDEIEANDD